MKKALLLILTLFLSLSISAQCLGEDCSIKGRNKAAKKKAVKMTGSKRAGNSYSSGKARKLKRKGNKGFDPFSMGKSKKRDVGGFDPFEAQSKKRKGSRGSAYDPFSSGKKSKRKGNSGGFDPFATGKKRKGVASGGYDPYKKGRKKLRNASSDYDGWDSNTSKRGRGRGRANDSWANSRKIGVTSGGNDSWASDNSKGVQKGGGTWLSRTISPRKYKGGGGNNSWDQTFDAGTAPPSYDRSDNYVRSYSDFESSNFSSDVVFDRPHYYKYSLIYGSVMNHSSNVDKQLTGVSPRPVLGAEFALEYPTQGDKNWHHYFNMPTYGFALTYLNLGEDDRLGSAVAFYPYIDIPLIRSRAIDFNFSNGFGVSYVTKYDQTTTDNGTYSTDPATFASSDGSYLIGSPINAFLKTGFNINIRPITKIQSDKDELNSRYTINAGISLMHMSNGSFSSPNTGMNILGGNITLKHTPTAINDVVRQHPDNLLHLITLDVMGTAGVREMSRLNTRKYVVGNLNIAAYYQVANIYRIGIGGDAFYDEVFQYSHPHIAGESDKYAGNYDPSDLLHSVRAGVALSNEIVLGRTTAAFDAGYYVYNNIKVDDEDMYYRFALKYRFTKNFFGAAALKTHKQYAESVTLGVGYSLPVY